MTDFSRAFEAIDSFAARWVEELGIPGLAIAITDREKLLRVASFGYADLASRAPVTADTLFEIGSLGKPFTSMSLLQLREEGRVDLEAPVTEYLPWFRVKSKHAPITVHHLLNHTAGIIRGTDLAPHGLYDVWALRQSATSAPPGEFFWYSNLGYKTLGVLLERVTGQSLGEVVQSRILDPLGMTRTHAVTTHESRRAAATSYCGLYDDRPEHRTHPLVPALWGEYATGDGCQASTAEDMARYLRMLLNRGRGPKQRLLSEESFRKLTLDGVWTGGDYYGYGLATYTADGRTYVGHGGGNAGYRSAIVVDLEAGLGVVFLLNRMGETDPIVEAAQHVLTVVRAEQRGDPPPPVPAFLDPSAIENASEYAGSYRAGEKTLRLRAPDGRLELEHAGERIVLERRTPDSFYVPHPDFEYFLLDFRREDGSVVEAFHGPHWYVNDRYAGPRRFRVPGAWRAYPGHYRARNPELASFRIVLRKGELALIIGWGTTEPLVPVGGGFFRVGADASSPERLRFAGVVDGRALRVDYSGCPYFRAFSP